jgi:hypothetical protein
MFSHDRSFPAALLRQHPGTPKASLLHAHANA